MAGGGRDSSAEQTGHSSEGLPALSTAGASSVPHASQNPSSAPTGSPQFRQAVMSTSSSCPRPRTDLVRHVHQFYPASGVGGENCQRPVAAFESETERALVRLTAENAPVTRGNPGPAR